MWHSAVAPALLYPVKRPFLALSWQDGFTQIASSCLGWCQPQPSLVQLRRPWNGSYAEGGPQGVTLSG